MAYEWAGLGVLVTGASSGIGASLARELARAGETVQLVARRRELLDTVLAECKAPAGLRYATFRSGDGVSFVHVASVETADGSNPLAQLSAFADFHSEIEDRCAVQPAVREATLVGSYRFLAD